MSTAAKVLVLFAHPALEKSRVNRRLAEAAAKVEGVKFHDLYEEYPDLQIPHRREQAMLRTHDTIVFQHPFYWYSSPAILKEWMDHVLTRGFAYGTGGDALANKTLVSVITTGGPKESYLRGSQNHFTLRELLAPFEQTARLCGMRYLPPYAIQGTASLTEPEIAEHARNYAVFLGGLRDGRINHQKVADYPCLGHGAENF